ncbi:MAG TPA: PxKF domain-containing protein [Vicinamibacterales bacterium]|nr:PxKF domain-containing protein [Vicinamibacterales bacterium]
MDTGRAAAGTGVGPCTITASQEGYGHHGIAASTPTPWYPADDVSRTFLVAYPYSGFLAPIDNAGINVARAGSAVPVKFSLSGDRGLAILADGSPIAAPVSCSGAALSDPIELAVTAGQSSLHYDPTEDQYVYVWKTDKAWAGTCRQLDGSLADHTVHSAIFQFRR